MGAVTGKPLLENDLVRVAEFMEREISADRLCYVADRLPALARLIWSEQPCALLERPLTSVKLTSASESDPAAPCADGDSAAAADIRPLT